MKTISVENSMFLEEIIKSLNANNLYIVNGSDNGHCIFMFKKEQVVESGPLTGGDIYKIASFRRPEKKADPMIKVLYYNGHFVPFYIEYKNGQKKQSLDVLTGKYNEKQHDMLCLFCDSFIRQMSLVRAELNMSKFNI